ncbi:MAG: hypothetical protein RSB41_02770 [Bacilli bacterium]
MNYKALEDLINILVKKSGEVLYSDVVDFEKKRLDTELKKAEKDKKAMLTSIESKNYIDEVRKTKVETELNYYTKYLNTIDASISKVQEEIDGLKTSLESNSEKEEIRKLEKDSRKLKKQLDFALLEENENKINQYNEEYESILSTIEEKRHNCKKRQELEEELLMLNDEENKTSETISLINEELKNDYTDVIKKHNDELSLIQLDSEIKSLHDSITLWDTNPEILGSEILSSYKEGKEFSSIEPTLNILLSCACTELKETQEEITGSNIFEIMDKYNKVIRKINTYFSTDKYRSIEKETSSKDLLTYQKTKVEKNRTSIEQIAERRNEVLDTINELNTKIKSLKVQRIELSKSLKSKQRRLFMLSLKNIDIEEIKEINKIIDTIKEEISLLLKEENIYITDISLYKEEIKNLDINYDNLKTSNISLEEEIEEINNNISNKEFLNNISLLEDKVSLIEYKNRLSSLTSEQQYLYVDPSVIKEEITVLWNRVTTEEEIEIETEEVTQSYDEIDDIEEIEEPINIIDDVELFDSEEN